MRSFKFTATLAVSAALVALAPVTAFGQAAKAAPKTYSPKRLQDGHPDLQGTYDLATLTRWNGRRGH